VSFRVSCAGFSYGLHDASFEIVQPGLSAIVGPNGAGKSTLIGIMAGLRTPYCGSVTFDGREISRWRRRDLAKHVAYLPQSMQIEFPFTAEQVVLMGRTPCSGGWFESPGDFRAAEEAMRVTDVLEFRSRDFRALSGGERQRVILAAAIAQEPRALILDEPTTFLDLKHQISIYRVLASLAKSMQVISVTHDLNLALQFADRVLVLDRGRIAGDGAPRDVLTPNLLACVFDVRAHIDGRFLHYEA